MRPDQSSARGARVALATLAVVLVAAIAATPAGAAPSTGLVVNEVYGGGGNSGATYTNDFVELANRGSSPVDVSGWSVQYHAATGTGPWQVTQLTGSIAPGDLYLVAQAAGSGGTTPLPTPQVTGTIPMAAASGTIALVNGTAALTCQDSAACQSASVDLIGYGTAVINETAAAPAGSNTTSLQRRDAADSDNNSGDFAAAAPTPAAANAGDGGGGTGEPGPLRIHDIQGGTWISPHDDEQVTNVPGIVTAVRSTGSRGFFVQDPSPDSNTASSEGIFVFTSSPGVAVGDSVLVSGTVKSHGDPALTLSPGRIDPTNPAWTTSRKPLAAEFSFRGRTVFAIANHFNSKGGDQSADGRFQFPAQSSAVQRAGQAQVMHDFVGKILNIDRKADVVVLGDLNDYQFSPAISALRTGTADGSGTSILTDLISTLPVNQRYTYVFNGVSQVLDHILVSSGVGAVQYQVVHINAEYADQASDHDPQVVRLQP